MTERIEKTLKSYEDAMIRQAGIWKESHNESSHYCAIAMAEAYKISAKLVNEIFSASKKTKKKINISQTNNSPEFNFIEDYQLEEIKYPGVWTPQFLADRIVASVKDGVFTMDI